MMVPYYRPDKGSEMPNNGTAHGDECACCGRRFSITYIIDGKRYCGDHVDDSGRAQKE